jgi:hypothetical protein
MLIAITCTIASNTNKAFGLNDGKTHNSHGKDGFVKHPKKSFFMFHSIKI